MAEPSLRYVGAAALPGGVRLRGAEPADEPFLRSLYASVRAAELAPVAWTEEQKRAFCDLQYTLQDRFYRDNFRGAAFEVIVEKGAAIGRLYRARAGTELRLLDIALVAGARGRGIGTALLRSLLDEARRDRLEVVLHVEHDNPARHLYQRLGFEPSEDLGVYLAMRWRLDAGAGIGETGNGESGNGESGNAAADGAAAEHAAIAAPGGGAEAKATPAG